MACQSAKYTFFPLGIHKFDHCWTKCIQKLGNYTEKGRLRHFPYRCITYTEINTNTDKHILTQRTYNSIKPRSLSNARHHCSQFVNVYGQFLELCGT